MGPLRATPIAFRGLPRMFADTNGAPVPLSDANSFAIDDALASFDANRLAPPQPPAPVVAPSAPTPVAPPVAAQPPTLDPEDRRASTQAQLRAMQPEPTVQPQRANLDDVRGYMAAAGILSGLAGRQQDMSPWLSELQRRQGGLDAQAGAEREQNAKALAARMADPRSPESLARQNSLRPYLKSSGLSDEDIARISAKDLESFTIKDAIGFASRAKTAFNGYSRDPNSPESVRAREVATQYGMQTPPDATEYEVYTYRPNAGAIAAQNNAHQNALIRQDNAFDNSKTLQSRGVNLHEGAAIRAEERSLTLAERKAQAEAAREDEPSAKIKIPGVTVDDQEVWTQAMRDPKQRNDAYLSSSASAQITRGMDKLLKLREENGVELFQGKNLADYELTRTGIVASLTTLFQTGVLNKEEYERYKQMLPSIDPSFSDAGLAIGYDAKLGQLEGARDALKDTIDAGWSRWGGRYTGASAPQAPPRHAQPKPAKPAAAPSGNDGWTTISADKPKGDDDGWKPL